VQRAKDASVQRALSHALRGDQRLSYADVQDIVRSTLDSGRISSQEQRDLRMILSQSKTLDPHSRGALTQFLASIDPRTGVVQRSGKAAIPQLAQDPGPFRRTHTDLGKFSHGCFDIAYVPSAAELRVSLQLAYKFEDTISAANQRSLKQRIQDAVTNWDRAGVYFETGETVLNPVIKLRFGVREAARGEHFVVDVDSDQRRAWVGIQLNIDQQTSVDTLTHELGHVFGNYDEYRGRGVQGWLERRMYWHDNDHGGDIYALMNQGWEFRLRYFDHFERYLNNHFEALGVTYKTVLPP